MTRKAATKILSNSTCTYTYCDHLTDGWYDEIKTFWKTQKVWCCFECCSIVELKKNQKIEELEQ
jgi:hypothetical protein